MTRGEAINVPFELELGSIRILSSDSVECIRFEPDGKVYVRGELVDDNMAVYEAFKAWLAKVNQ